MISNNLNAIPPFQNYIMPDSLSLDQSKSRGKSKVEFVFNNPHEDLSSCTLVTGFYGLGKCGFISVNHMVDNLDAKLIGYVVSEFLPPFISIKNERIVLPFEIYRYDDVVFIATYFEPYKYEQRSFAESIIKTANDMNFDRIIIIGGLDSRLRVDNDVLAKESATIKRLRIVNGKLECGVTYVIPWNEVLKNG